MPRRRGSSTQRPQSTTRGRPQSSHKLSRKDSQLRRWNVAGDVPEDEEDEFHSNRDKVLFENSIDNEDDDEDDEVFALPGLDGEAGMDDEDEDDSGLDNSRAEEEDNASKRAKSRSAKSKSKQRSLSPPSEDEEGWGSKKSAYYSTNAGEIDSEDDETNELYEKETKRLQMKQRKSLSEEDFTLDALVDQIPEPAASASSLLAPSIPQNEEDLVLRLEKSCPEVLALARDLDNIVVSISNVESKLSAQDTDSGTSESGLYHLYYQALLTYATNIAFYLRLASTKQYSSEPGKLRSHPILDRLATLREAIVELEVLCVDEDSSDGAEEIDFDIDDDDDILYDDVTPSDTEMSSPPSVEVRVRSGSIEKGPPGPLSLKPPKRSGKTAKKPSKTMPQPIFDLEEPTFKRSRKPLATSDASAKDLSTFGELISLDKSDALDKQSRKKSLRFHTSRIEHVASRRTDARNRLGGDDDIPYPERRKDAEARAQRALAPVAGQGGDDLDDADVTIGPSNKKRQREEDVDTEEVQEDGYYGLVKRQKINKKEAKKAAYEAEKESHRIDYSENKADGPRSLTRAIMTNKGLTAHRSKVNRNPRLKKRLRFEKAKKKLSSQKPVFKAGVKDKYGGESSGISARVVKSVRL
ncbi:hypothetical protein SISNIDRAFT_486114 [Sistotremastrum niveocremeum HHB9708]|uniref:Sas10 C-terminal domain-containing protein n=1 Tax=Sistotremastrum niveocremeum HHB9708 TaxID=1314777 RepID=A0A164UG34_9AGAM|nr:hypothetical protein SISNIDRAFT_486114 [Sistotremastrum niveocremeum HHB9708]